MVELVKTETKELKICVEKYFGGRQHGLLKVAYLELLQGTYEHLDKGAFQVVICKIPYILLRKLNSLGLRSKVVTLSVEFF